MGREAVEAAGADDGAGLGMPQSERKPLVTLRKMTLGRSARSEALLLGGTARSVRKVKNCARHRLVCRCNSAPASVMIGMASKRSRRRSALARYWANVLSFRVDRRRPTAMAQHNKRRTADAKHGSPASMAYSASLRT